MTPETRGLLTILTGSLYVLLFGGINFGFTSLIPMLTSQGIFESVCKATEIERPCPGQSVIYTNLFTAGAFGFNFSAWPIGLLIGRVGSKNVAYMSSILCSIGCLGLTFVLPKSFEIWSTASFIILSIGGRGIFLSVIANVSRPMHIIIVSAANDIACSVFFTWLKLYEVGVPFVYFFAFFSALALTLIPIVFFVWKTKDEREGASGFTEDDYEEVIEEEYNSKSYDNNDEVTENSALLASPIDDYESLTAGEPTFKQQVLNHAFLITTVVFSAGALVINMYIPSAENVIFQVSGSKEQKSIYVSVLSIGLVVGGLIAIPLFTYIEEKYSPIVGSWFSFLFQFLFSLFAFVSLLIGEPGVNPKHGNLALTMTGTTFSYFALITACLFRPFMFALRGDILIYLFGRKRFPQLLGLMTTVIAVFGLFQYLLSPLALVVMKSWTLVYGLLCLFSLFCLVYPIYLKKINGKYKNLYY